MPHASVAVVLYTPSLTLAQVAHVIDVEVAGAALPDFDTERSTASS